MTNKQAQDEKTRDAFERWAEQSGALPWGILKKHRNEDGSYPGPHYTYMWNAWSACHEALLDELEAAEKRIAELEARTVKLPEYRNSPDMHTKQFYEAIGFNQGLDVFIEALRAAGIGVKVE